MKLPTQKSEPEITNPDLMIFYGPPKVGKTTLLSTLENNLIVDLENGTKYLSALKVNIDSIQDIKDLGKTLKEEGCPYDYLTFDPVNRLEELAKEEAKKEYIKTPQGKNFDTNEDILSLPRGAGYYWLRIGFMKILNYFRGIVPHVILCGHLKTTVGEKEGKEVDVKDLDLTGKIKTLTCQEADAIGYVYRGEDSSLNISFKSSENLVCGARPDHLKGQDLKIADYDPEKNDLVNIEWNKIFK